MSWSAAATRQPCARGSIWPGNECGSPSVPSLFLRVPSVAQWKSLQDPANGNISKLEMRSPLCDWSAAAGKLDVQRFWKGSCHHLLTSETTVDSQLEVGHPVDQVAKCCLASLPGFFPLQAMLAIKGPNPKPPLPASSTSFRC